MTEKEPREHGIILGRGDELGDDVELTGEILWELRGNPPSGPILH